MTLDQLFLRCVPYTPDRDAVATVDERYTYRDLSRCAASYKAAFTVAGLGAGDRLVALLDPGIEALASLCACSQLGIIWTPVSPEDPLTRIQAIVDALSPGGLVSGADGTILHDLRSRAAIGQLTPSGARWLRPLPGARKAPAPRQVIDSDAAYIVFGSGESRPLRGVVMTHGAACRLLQTLLLFNALPIGSIVASAATVASRLWILTAATALGNGGTIAVLPRSRWFRPRELALCLESCGAHQLNAAPVIWEQLAYEAEAELKEIRTLSALFSTGGPIRGDAARRLQLSCPDLRIMNAFGQSECLAYSFGDVTDPARMEMVSIGRGCDGMELLLLDADGRRVTTPRVPGELYVRAASLFTGYWNDPVGTSEALMPHPLLPETGERVLRTGDVAYFDEEGDFFFCGRRDSPAVREVCGATRSRF